MSTNSLFRPAENTSAYLKMALLGFAGSGKTKTGSKTGIGLVQHMRELKLSAADKPVYFLDTETGSDWVKPDFDEAGIPLMVAKTRAFADLVAAVKDAEKNASVLVVDSVTHFWKDLCDSYCRRKAEQFKVNSYRLQFQDWGFLKGDDGWGAFSSLFVNSSLHIIICGRAGFEYDYIEDEQDSKKKNLEKTGVKMKAEGEFGFEPSLLVYMERSTNMRTMEVTRTATVLKDRSTLLDGAEIENPTFKDFLPHIARLNLGGRQLGVDMTRNSDHMIPVDQRDNTRVQREIVLDEIGTVLTLHYPSSSNEDKKNKLKAVLKHFDATWTEIEKVMPLSDLRAGYDSLYRELENKPSRYAVAVSQQTPAPINDALPDHSAPPAQAAQPAQPPAAAAPLVMDTFELLKLKTALLADIPNLLTLNDCLNWAKDAQPKKELLAEPDQGEVDAAFLKQQANILRPARPARAKAPHKDDDPAKNDGKDPATEPKPDTKPVEETKLAPDAPTKPHRDPKDFEDDGTGIPRGFRRETAPAA